jgi:hypothetical protein
MNGSDNNSLVNSLLAFNNSSDNQEIIDYLSEHLYIQSQIAMPRVQKLGNIKGMTDFYRACHKLYYAGDEKVKNQAIDEIRLQVA